MYFNVKELIDGDYLALMSALLDSDIGEIKRLIEAGADVNAKDNRGCTVLMWAIYKDNIKTAKLLIEAGADVNIKDDDGDTALDWFKKYNRLTKLLIKAGAKK